MDRRNGLHLAGRRRSVMLSAIAGAAMLALVSACGGESPQEPAPDVRPAAVGQEDLTALPDATTYATVADAPLDRDPTGTTSGRVIRPKSDLVVYQEVGGKPIAKLPTLQVGSPTWVPVIAEQGEWAQILLPSRPNAATGWVYADAASVESAQNNFAVYVKLDAFELEIMESGKSIGKWKIGIGKSEYPTPTGRAYIIASIAETVNKYSPIVLPLSVHSESHETFGGGPGTVGIHTWPDDSFVGKADSDGCIRVTKDALDKLVELPLGTIVSIT